MRTKTAQTTDTWLYALAIAAALLILPAAQALAEPADIPEAGGLALGEAYAGVTDQAFAYGPPGYAYIVTRSPGAFLDCGNSQDARAHDALGQSALDLACGVTLTETVSVPQVGVKARLVVHY